MTNQVLSENFRKFRTARGLTQEQVAAVLNVNAQTVSRWECAATLPDVLMLPELARLYGVTVDDFYKKRSIAYDNYAQRLSSVYEKTRDPEDFLRCLLEYQKLMKDGELYSKVANRSFSVVKVTCRSVFPDSNGMSSRFIT